MLTTANIVSAALSLAIALAIAFPLSGALKKSPVVFYAIAGVATVAYLAYWWSPVYSRDLQMVVLMFQKGYLSCWLLAIVMFTGAFDETSAIRHRLQPIRAELSILSFVFAISHVLFYLPNYLPNLFGRMSADALFALSITAAFLLTALFIVLTVTSFHVVRKAMSPRGWKNLQRWSYVMVGLLWVHIVLAVARPLFTGGRFSADSAVALVVYTLITVVYAVLRIRKAVRDAGGRAPEVEDAAPADAA